MVWSSFKTTSDFTNVKIKDVFFTVIAILTLVKISHSNLNLAGTLLENPTDILTVKAQM